MCLFYLPEHKLNVLVSINHVVVLKFLRLISDTVLRLLCHHHELLNVMVHCLQNQRTISFLLESNQEIRPTLTDTTNQMKRSIRKYCVNTHQINSQIWIIRWYHFGYLKEYFHRFRARVFGCLMNRIVAVVTWFSWTSVELRNLIVLVKKQNHLNLVSMER